eukprot:4326710-Pyramimonas_sp.AAC.2
MVEVPQRVNIHQLEIGQRAPVEVIGVGAAPIHRFRRCAGLQAESLLRGAQPLCGERSLRRLQARGGDRTAADGGCGSACPGDGGRHS